MSSRRRQAVSTRCPAMWRRTFGSVSSSTALYNQLPDGHPNLLFKGGTSLSKAFGLIDRFSEDIDLVVYRDGLGFEGERDPTVTSNLSNRKRAALFKELRAACSGYVCGDLQTALANLIDEIVEGCHVGPDEDDVDGQTLFVEYPTLYPSGDIAYVAPRVRIEAGARSALDPSLNCTITPHVVDELPDWSFDVGDIRVIRARAHLLGEATDPAWCALRIPGRRASPG